MITLLILGIILKGTVLVQAVPSSDPSLCPSGWTNYDKSCYFLHTHDKYDWVESRGFCQTHSAHLAFIESDAENNFVKAHIASKLDYDGMDAEDNDNVWIGANDEIEEGKFVWYDVLHGIEKPVTYTAWGPSEPNSQADQDIEDCLIYWADYQWEWADLNCHEEEFFICEKPIEILSPVNVIG